MEVRTWFERKMVYSRSGFRLLVAWNMVRASSRTPTAPIPRGGHCTTTTTTTTTTNGHNNNTHTNNQTNTNNATSNNGSLSDGPHCPGVAGARGTPSCWAVNASGGETL